MLQAEWYGAKDFFPPMDSASGLPMGGRGGIRRGLPLLYTPILFVHGTMRDAHDFDTLLEKFKDKGYIEQELWAVSYNGRQFPGALATHKDNAVDLQNFVVAMLDYLQTDKIDIVAHSFGVTLTRYWMREYDMHKTVRRCVFIAGGNHGIHMDRLSVRMTGEAGKELAASSKFLKGLNSGSESPCDYGVERCAVIWDGTGIDMTFSKPIDYHSPILMAKPNAKPNPKRTHPGVTHIQKPGMSHMRLITDSFMEQHAFLTAP